MKRTTISTEWGYEMNIEKHKIVKVPIEEQIVAFQMITISANFFGKTIAEKLDTKIMADGRQIVIDGNGFLKRGTEI